MIFILSQARARANKLFTEPGLPELPVIESARATEPVLELVPPDMLVWNFIDPPSLVCRVVIL